jgi:ATP-binding cassette subfamily B protein
VTIALESHVASLQASVATIEHHERPEHLDRLAMLRNQVFVLDHMYMSLFTTCGWVLRLIVALGLLMSVNPLLALLALFALPTVLASTWRPEVERRAGARRAAQLPGPPFDTATTRCPERGARMRVGPRLLGARRQAWERWYGPVAAARWGTAVWNTLGWAVFGCAYVAAVAFVALRMRASPGDVLLVLTAGWRLSNYLGAAVGEIGFLRGIWLDGSKRMAWLEDYAATLVQDADAPVPERLTSGVRFEKVSFAYPGTQKLVLEDVDLELRPGSVVALVGENGGRARQAALPHVPTDPREDHDRRGRARADPARGRASVRGRSGSFFRYDSRRAAAWGWAACRHGRRARGRSRSRARRRQRRGRGPHRRARDPARADLAPGRGPLLRAVAEARARARLHAREAARAGARRADRRARRRDRARAVRALRRRRARRRPADHPVVSHRFSTVRMADFIVALDGARGRGPEPTGADGQKRGQYASWPAGRAPPVAERSGCFARHAARPSHALPRPRRFPRLRTGRGARSRSLLERGLQTIAANARPSGSGS